MSYRLNKKTMKNILADFLETDRINKDLAIEGIVYSLSDSTMEYIIYLLSEKNRIQLIQPNDYIKVNINTYDIDKKFNYDILNEMGLLCKETNSIYGKVIDDASWSSGYNPYYGSIKIIMFYHDEQGNKKDVEETINTVDAIKIDKNDIPYFKYVKNKKV